MLIIKGETTHVVTCLLGLGHKFIVEERRMSLDASVLKLKLYSVKGYLF